jgi:GNAT acetyltransferase
MIDANALIEMQLRLECKGLDAEGLLIRIPGPDPDDIPRCLVVRHLDTYRVLFRHDLSRHIRERVAMLPPEMVFGDHEAVKQVLADDAPVEAIWTGRSYIFPSILARADYPDTVRLDRATNTQPVYAVRVADQIVATCESVRENDAAAEAWVQTLPGFRRRGYARQVTAAWAQGVLDQGKTPFYSHSLDNLASQGVARSLGLVPFIDAIAYT